MAKQDSDTKLRKISKLSVYSSRSSKLIFFLHSITVEVACPLSISPLLYQIGVPGLCMLSFELHGVTKLGWQNE